ncbi:MAG: CDP-alcohol phosphatidyltransferase family protein [Clostridiales bacterium]|jgi:CDP-diacylglycerol--glycerol-3-phosphate 3-phosphatidyltransferase|nr:CDP-alcohol phosphatidyltransferase family protein [Clostridiales bacterium]
MKNIKYKLFTVPNIITYARILLIPAFAVAMFYDSVWGLALFALCAGTDFFDGYIARRFNMVSNIGKFLDPLADKLMQITVMVCMSVLYAEKTPPFYILAVVLVSKETLQLVMGFFLLTKKVVVPANIYGKAATVILAVGIGLLFLAGAFGDAAENTLYIIGFTVCAAGVAAAVFALVMYAVIIAKQLNYKVPAGDKNIEINTGLKSGYFGGKADEKFDNPEK